MENRKKRTSAKAEAERRRAAENRLMLAREEAVRRPDQPLDRARVSTRTVPYDVARSLTVLSAVREGLADVPEFVSDCLTLRDRAVEKLREEGWSWERIAQAAGVSRQALMKRAVGPSRAHP